MTKGWQDEVDDICLKIIEILEVYMDGVGWGSIGYDADLAEYGMDSMIFIQVIADIEAQFDIEIPDEFLLGEKMNTIGKIADVVQGCWMGVYEEERGYTNYYEYINRAVPFAGIVLII